MQDPSRTQRIAPGERPFRITEAEFHRRFGGVGAPPYQAVLRDIEARLDTLPLLAPVR